MTLAQRILEIYPELEEHWEYFSDGTIMLKNDSDGSKTYIHIWNYEYSQPTQEQLGEYD